MKPLSPDKTMPEAPSRDAPSAAAPFAAPLADTPDAVLLERFLNQRDNAAFEVLLRRHGGLVMGLLKRMSLQEADAEDGFQATFLTLVRKAAAIGKRDALASWLYKVAFRIGLELRERVKRRHSKEQTLTGSELAPMHTDVAEFWKHLDAEVMRLPEKYRVPFVLCHLQGLPLEQAAQQIGCPLGTVGTRLAWARKTLRSRLTRQGLVLSAATVVVCLREPGMAQAAPAQSVLDNTLAAAEQFRNGVLAGAVAAEVIALSDAAVKALFMAKVKAVAALAVAALVLGLVVAVAWPRGGAAGPAPSPDWLHLWGKVVDPDRDSRFGATPALLSIQVPGGAHAFADRGRANPPRVVREVRGDFQVQVKVTPKLAPTAPDAFEKNLFAPEAGPLNASAFQGAGILIMHDDDNFLKLFQGTLHENGAKNFLAWQTRVGGVNQAGVTLHPRNVAYNYLRIERIGPHLFFAGSPDGERWKYLPSVTTAWDEEQLTVGLVAGHNTTAEFEAVFSDFTLHRFHWGNNPQPLKGKGPPLLKGCARCH